MKFDIIWSIALVLLFLISSLYGKQLLIGSLNVATFDVSKAGEQRASAFIRLTSTYDILMLQISGFTSGFLTMLRQGLMTYDESFMVTSSHEQSYANHAYMCVYRSSVITMQADKVYPQTFMKRPPYSALFHPPNHPDKTFTLLAARTNHLKPNRDLDVVNAVISKIQQERGLQHAIAVSGTLNLHRADQNHPFLCHADWQSVFNDPDIFGLWDGDAIVVSRSMNAMLVPHSAAHNRAMSGIRYSFRHHHGILEFRIDLDILLAEDDPFALPDVVVSTQRELSSSVKPYFASSAKSLHIEPHKLGPSTSSFVPDGVTNDTLLHPSPGPSGYVPSPGSSLSTAPRPTDWIANTPHDGDSHSSPSGRLHSDRHRDLPDPTSHHIHYGLHEEQGLDEHIQYADSDSSVASTSRDNFELSRRFTENLPQRPGPQQKNLAKKKRWSKDVGARYHVESFLQSAQDITSEKKHGSTIKYLRSEKKQHRSKHSGKTLHSPESWHQLSGQSQQRPALEQHSENRQASSRQSLGRAQQHSRIAQRRSSDIQQDSTGSHHPRQSEDVPVSLHRYPSISELLLKPPRHPGVAERPSESTPQYSSILRELLDSSRHLGKPEQVSEHSRQYPATNEQLPPASHRSGITEKRLRSPRKHLEEPLQQPGLYGQLPDTNQQESELHQQEVVPLEPTSADIGALDQLELLEWLTKPEELPGAEHEAASVQSHHVFAQEGPLSDILHLNAQSAMPSFLQTFVPHGAWYTEEVPQASGWQDVSQAAIGDAPQALGWKDVSQAAVGDASQASGWQHVTQAAVGYTPQASEWQDVSQAAVRDASQASGLRDVTQAAVGYTPQASGWQDVSQAAGYTPQASGWQDVSQAAAGYTPQTSGWQDVSQAAAGYPPQASGLQDVTQAAVGYTPLASGWQDVSQAAGYTPQALGWQDVSQAAAGYTPQISGWQDVSQAAAGYSTQASGWQNVTQAAVGYTSQASGWHDVYQAAVGGASQASGWQDVSQAAVGGAPQTSRLQDISQAAVGGAPRATEWQNISQAAVGDVPQALGWQDVSQAAVGYAQQAVARPYLNQAAAGQEDAQAVVDTHSVPPFNNQQFQPPM